MKRGDETVLQFDCAGETLLGICHAGADDADTGVVIVVGGPQYRVGSHRQFVLLARQLAAAGIPVLRFDYRGMGDSTGAPCDFEHIDADLRAACDAFCAAQPQLRRLVLWGLCDAASANLFYAATDSRVAALVLLNPWLRQAQSQARTVIQHYYRQRLFSADLWRKLLRGQFAWRKSLASLWTTLRQARAKPQPTAATVSVASTPSASTPALTANAGLSVRMANGWRAFHGPMLLILSGDDLVAKEFEQVSQQADEWQGLRAQARIETVQMPAANHTFARAEWRDEVAAATQAFVARVAASVR